MNLVVLRWALVTFEAGNWHPLTWISHALDVQIFGLAPAGHHLHSMLLHAANAVLLFLLLWKATGSQTRCLIVAALFAVHPLNVECVAWAAERKSVLSTLFFLLALAAYGWYAAKPSVSRYGTLTALFAMGLTAKPMVITLPFLLLLLDYWPLQRIQLWTSPLEPWVASRKPPLMLVIEKLPLLFIATASAALTLAAQWQAVVPLQLASFSERLANALNAYLLYLLKCVWPVHLALFYPRTAPRLSQVALAAAILIVISLWAWRERRARPYLLVGCVWYVGTLVPVIGLVQVGAQSMADRYAYIPLIGIFVALVWRLGDAIETRRIPRWIPRAVGAASLLVLSVLTWRQTGYWQNSMTVWSHTLAVQPYNVLAEDKLGAALIEAGRDEDAIVHFRNATRVQPAEPKAHLALGSLLLKRGDVQSAIAQFQIASSLVESRDDRLALYTSLGVAYRQAGDYERATDSFEQLLKLDPANVQIIGALGRVQMLGAADRLAKELDQHPTAEGFIQLANLWEQAGEATKAKQAQQAALALRSQRPPTTK